MKSKININKKNVALGLCSALALSSLPQGVIFADDILSNTLQEQLQQGNPIEGDILDDSAMFVDTLEDEFDSEYDLVIENESERESESEREGDLELDGVPEVDEEFLEDTLGTLILDDESEVVSPLATLSLQDENASVSTISGTEYTYTDSEFKYTIVETDGKYYITKCEVLNSRYGTLPLEVEIDKFDNENALGESDEVTAYWANGVEIDYSENEFTGTRPDGSAFGPSGLNLLDVKNENGEYVTISEINLGNFDDIAVYDSGSREINIIGLSSSVFIGLEDYTSNTSSIVNISGGLYNISVDGYENGWFDDYDGYYCDLVDLTINIENPISGISILVDGFDSIEDLEINVDVSNGEDMELTLGDFYEIEVSDLVINSGDSSSIWLSVYGLLDSLTIGSDYQSNNGNVFTFFDNNVYVPSLDITGSLDKIYLDASYYLTNVVLPDSVDEVILSNSVLGTSELAIEGSKLNAISDGGFYGYSLAMSDLEEDAVPILDDLYDVITDNKLKVITEESELTINLNDEHQFASLFVSDNVGTLSFKNADSYIFGAGLSTLNLGEDVIGLYVNIDEDGNELDSNVSSLTITGTSALDTLYLRPGITTLTLSDSDSEVSICGEGVENITGSDSLEELTLESTKATDIIIKDASSLSSLSFGDGLAPESVEFTAGSSEITITGGSSLIDSVKLPSGVSELSLDTYASGDLTISGNSLALLKGTAGSVTKIIIESAGSDLEIGLGANSVESIELPSNIETFNGGNLGFLTALTGDGLSTISLTSMSEGDEFTINTSSSSLAVDTDLGTLIVNLGESATSFTLTATDIYQLEVNDGGDDFSKIDTKLCGGGDLTYIDISGITSPKAESFSILTEISVDDSTIVLPSSKEEKLNFNIETSLNGIAVDSGNITFVDTLNISFQDPEGLGNDDEMALKTSNNDITIGEITSGGEYNSATINGADLQEFNLTLGVEVYYSLFYSDDNIISVKVDEVADDGSKKYTSDSVVVVEVEEGYQLLFKNSAGELIKIDYTKDVDGDNTYTFKMPESNLALELCSLSIDFSANNSDYGSVSGLVDEVGFDGGMVIPEKTYTFTADPSEGYSFEKWDIIGGEGFYNESIDTNENPLTITITDLDNLTGDETISIIALFSDKNQLYNLALNYEPNESTYGSVASSNISSGTNTTSGASYILEATAKDGYEFVEWQIDGGDTFYEITSEDGSSLTITMGNLTGLADNGDITIKAVFKEIYKVSLGYSSDNLTYGSVTSSFESGGNVEASGIYTFTASPETDCEFVEWEITGGEGLYTKVESDGGLTLAITMGDLTELTSHENITIKAVFKEVHEVSLSYSSSNGDHGSVTSSFESGGNVNAGDPYTFTASPEDGYKLKEWEITGGEGLYTKEESGSTLTLTMNSELSSSASISIKAIFEENTDGVSLSYSSNDTTYGSVTEASNFTSGGNVEAGDTYTFTASPEDGYKFKEWEITGGEGLYTKEESDDGLTLTLTMGSDLSTSASISIQGIFKSNDDGGDYDLSLSYSASNGSISSDFTSGENVDTSGVYTFTASANSGYTFSSWTVTGGDGLYTKEEVGSTLTLTIGDLETLTASGNISVVANFTQNETTTTPTPTYSLSLKYSSSDSEQGSVTSSDISTGGSVSTGRSYIIDATPEDGYEFDSWSISGGSGLYSKNEDGSSLTITINNSLSLSSNQTISVTASFKKVEDVPVIPPVEDEKDDDDDDDDENENENENENVLVKEVSASYKGMKYTLKINYTKDEDTGGTYYDFSTAEITGVLDLVSLAESDGILYVPASPMTKDVYVLGALIPVLMADASSIMVINDENVDISGLSEAELLKLLQGAKIVPDLEILQDGVLTIDATSSDLSKVVIDQDADVDEVIIITSSESFELEAESVSGVVVGGSNLEEVKLPESVTSVEITETSSSIEIIADNVSEVVVGGANLEEVKLPESVISVEITETSSSIEIIADNVSEVVVGSSNLEEVKLPESVTSVEITETSADESFTLVLTGDESSLENVNFTSSSDADNFTLNNQTTNSVEVDIKLDGESFANLNPEAGEESLIPTETPSIATQPKDANYKLGAQAEALKVEANLIGGLGELSYQWFKDGEEISGATKATYTPSTDTEGAFEYYCVVTNLYNAETKSTSSNKAKITISSQDDDDSDEVAVKSITLSKDTLSLKVSGTETLTFTINPSNATNQNVTWTSSNEKVAKVDNNGKITAIGVGSATISITTEDGEKTDNCAVSVTSSSSGSSSSSSSGSSSGGGSSLGSANSSSSSSATTTEASIESTTIDTSTGFNEFNPDIEVEEEKDPSATLKINTSQELLSKLASATSEDEIEILKDEYYEDIIIKYSDLEEASYGAPHWGRHAVAFCLKQGYFDGIYGDKTDEEVDFGIDDFATRLEIVQVLANMVEDISEFTYNSDFVDVELDSEGSNAVAWAVSKEITNGTNQETKEFSPSANVERQEMATFFDRFITSLGVELELPEVDGSDNFTDSESIYPYAKDSISKLQNVGIIQGNNDGSFNPLSNITRAELATMVEKLVLLLAQD